MQRLLATVTKVLIIGLGYLGQALARTLTQAGHIVYGLKRSPLTIEGVEVITHDLNHPLPSLPAVDYVFYLVSPDTHDVLAYQKAYHTYLAQCLDAYTHLTRFFFISSTSVYHQNNGELVDETSPTQPTRAHAKQLLIGESLVTASPLPSTIIRLSGIYGPKRTGLLQRIQTGQTHLTHQPMTMHWIHQQDAIGILMHLMHHPKPESWFIVTDCSPYPRNTLITTLAKDLQVPTPHYSDTIPTHGAYRTLSHTRLRDSGYQWHHPDCLVTYRALIKQML